MSDIVRTPDEDLYALSLQHVYRSVDGGDTWVPVTPVPASALAAAPDGAVYAWASSSAWRSDDDGESWQRLAHAPGHMQSMAFDPAGRGYAGTLQGLYRTLDRGATWTRLGLPEVKVGVIEPAGSGALYAGVDREVWRSDDGGENWTRVATLPAEPTAIAERPQGGLYVGVAPDLFLGGGAYVVDAAGGVTPAGLEGQYIADWVVRGNAVLAAGAGICGGFVCWGPGVFRSVDGGATWDLTGASTASVSALIDGGGFTYFAATRYLFTDVGGFPALGVLRSTDSGRTWSPANRGIAQSTVYSLDTNATGWVVAAADQTLFVSRDRGATWQPVFQRPPHEIREGSLSFDVAIDDGGVLYALAPSDKLYVTRDLGITWSARRVMAITGGSGRPDRLIRTARGTLIVSTVSPSGLLRSTTGGLTWTPAAEFGHGFLNEVVDLTAAGSTVFVSTEEALFRSVDDGVSWHRIADVSGPLAASADGRTLYVGSRSGPVKLQEATNWTPEALPALQGISDLLVAQGVVYAATQAAHLWRWVAGAGAWEDLGGPSCNVFVLGLHRGRYEVEAAVDDAGFVYVTSNCAGVYRTDVSTPVAVEDLQVTATADDVRLHWRLSPAALEDLDGIRVQRAGTATGPFDDRTRALAARPQMTWIDTERRTEDVFYRLALVANGATVGFTPAVRVGGLAAAAGRPRLEAIVELPGTGRVQMRYRTPAGGVPVRLGIFDARGRRVRVLDEGSPPSGVHVRTWDRRDLAGRPVARGVYLVRLQAGTFQDSAKLVLVHDAAR